jgi:hypothetical protein
MLDNDKKEKISSSSPIKRLKGSSKCPKNEHNKYKDITSTIKKEKGFDFEVQNTERLNRMKDTVGKILDKDYTIEKNIIKNKLRRHYGKSKQENSNNLTNFYEYSKNQKRSYKNDKEDDTFFSLNKSKSNFSIFSSVNNSHINSTTLNSPKNAKETNLVMMKLEFLTNRNKDDILLNHRGKIYKEEPLQRNGSVIHKRTKSFGHFF